MHLLIPWARLRDHEDPVEVEFTYGNVGRKGKKLRRDLAKGDYVFFHGMVYGRKCISSYYVVDRVLPVRQAVSDPNIMAKYRNPHLGEVANWRPVRDEVVLFGDPILSRKLDVPLPFDRQLAKRLSLDIPFTRGKTETQCIGSATRSWRRLTNRDVRVLLQAIKKTEQRARVFSESLLSTDEVGQFVEKDLESLLASNPRLLGRSLQVTGRQFDTDVGRIDLLLEARAGGETVVELKLGRIGREAVSQLRRYMRWIRKTATGKNRGKRVRGIIVCEGVLPAFERELLRLRNIEVFRYGWRFGLRRLTAGRG